MKLQPLKEDIEITVAKLRRGLFALTRDCERKRYVCCFIVFVLEILQLVKDGVKIPGFRLNFSVYHVNVATVQLFCEMFIDY